MFAPKLHLRPGTLSAGVAGHIFYFDLAWARAIFSFTKLMVFLIFQGGVDRDTMVRRWLQRPNGPFSFHPKETSAGVNPPVLL